MSMNCSQSPKSILRHDSSTKHITGSYEETSVKAVGMLREQRGGGMFREQRVGEHAVSVAQGSILHNDVEISRKRL